MWKSETIAGSPVAVAGDVDEQTRTQIAEAFATKANVDYLTENGFCESVETCQVGEEGGWGFVAVDDVAMEASRKNPAPRFYWDWRLRQSPLSYRKFCGTPPQSLLAGLEASLLLIEREGEAAVLARHRRLADAVHAAVARWSEGGALSFFGDVPDSRSVSVTTIAVAPGVDPEAMRTVARERFEVAIAGGLGPLAGRAFRIGHLGDINAAMVLGALAGVEAALAVQRIPFGRGGVEQAIASLAAD